MVDGIAHVPTDAIDEYRARASSENDEREHRPLRVRRNAGSPRTSTRRTRESVSVLVVRATKKVLDRVGGVTATDDDRSTTRLGDWYVNVLFWKPQVALFVSEATLLPVLVPFAPAASLIDRFPTALLAHLQAHEIPRSFTEQELGEMEPSRLAKTASRSVLGVMNEFKYLADVYAELDDESDLLALSMRLAETPCGPLYKRHVSPDRELAALVDEG